LKAKEETVWKSLADPTRRQILDLLAESPRTIGEICLQFKKITRFGVMKHLRQLEDSKLVLTKKEGRQKWCYLNSIPIQQIYDRWVSKYVGRHSRAFTELKRHIERNTKK
jgi:DNA-binding transcriptional ArsR family regulator